MAKYDSLCGKRLGEFLIRALLEEGGFCLVYRADQVMLGREAVVKVLHKKLRHHDEALRRFSREALFAARLDHPFAAHLYDAQHERDGLLWIAMEMIHGVTLKDWIQTHGPMTLEQLVPFFERVAQVVQTAHERNIVHRDLKPSNVMIVERAGQLLPKLLDFGVAKLLDDVHAGLEGMLPGFTTKDATAVIRRRAPTNQLSPITSEGTTIGSPPFMAPEQWEDPAAVGPAADLYALGVLAYQTLTGRLPYDVEAPEVQDAETAEKVAQQFGELHRKAPIPSLGNGCSPQLDQIFQRALAKRPEDRFATALGFAAALRGEIDRQAAAAERRRRNARRRRWLVVGVAAIVVAAVLYRGYLKTQMSEQVAAHDRVQAEVEQGRQALLHDEGTEAAIHLSRAHQLGARDPAFMFMLTHALQPHLAQRAVLQSSTGRMLSAAFSPDAQRVVTGDDRAAHVWDTATGRRLLELAHGAAVNQAAWIVDGTQGLRIATAGTDGSVKVWDAATGTQLQVLRGHRHEEVRYFRLAASPSGRLLAAMDNLGQVVDVWNARSGELLAELANDGSEAPSLAFSADERWLATSGGGDVRVFDAATWARVATLVKPAAGGRVWWLAFDPRGSRLATGTSTGDVSIWAIPTGERLQHLRDAGEAVATVAYSPDGHLVAAGARDGTEQIWDAATGQLVSQLNPRHSTIQFVEFDRTSRRLLAAGADGTVVLADVAQGIPTAVLEGPGGAVRIAHFDPSSELVLGASADGTARIWSARSSYQRWGTPPLGDCGNMDSLAPEQAVIAVKCDRHATRVIDTAHNQVLAELPEVADAPGDYFSALPAVSQTGDLAAIARGNTVEIYATPSATLVRKIEHRAPVNAVAFAATGHDLVSGSVDGMLQVTRDGHEPMVLSAGGAGIDAVVMLADGRVVAADAAGALRIYDAAGARLAELASPTRVRTLRPSPDGRRLVTLAVRTLPVAPVLWDLERYQMTTRLDGHLGRVFSIRFMAGMIVTGGSDGSARLWDSRTGRMLRAFGSTRSVPISDATLSADGTLLVTGGRDGQLRFWDVPTGHQLWALQAHHSYVIGVRFDGDDIVTLGFDGDASRWDIQRPMSAELLDRLTACLSGAPVPNTVCAPTRSNMPEINRGLRPTPDTMGR